MIVFRLRISRASRSIGSAPALSTHVEATLYGRRIVGKARASMKDVLDLSADVPKIELDGKGPISIRSWRRARGHVSIDARADLWERVTSAICFAISAHADYVPRAGQAYWASLALANGFAERLIGLIRRECVDHFVVLGEAHLRRMLESYLL